LRLKRGEAVILFDGKGNEFNGILNSAEKLHAVIEVGKRLDRKVESSLCIHLVYGLARFEKTDWVIQKATELGVNKITPLITQYCEFNLAGFSPSKSLANRLERWRSIGISACEQSGRLMLPEIENPIQLNEWLQQSHQGLGLIFHPGGETSVSS